MFPKSYLLSLIFIFALGAFLRLYKLPPLLPSSSDEGRDLQIAENIIKKGRFPSFGPPSSLGWMRLGPSSYYLWAAVLSLSNFHPLSIPIFIVLLDAATIILLFYLAFSLFGAKTALLAGLLFATSGYAIFHSRMPIHASLIPFFTSLFYLFLWKFVDKKRDKYFYLSCLLLGILLQLHLSTIILAFILFIFSFKKLNLAKIAKGIILLVLPFVPFILGDLRDYFFMTGRFLIWIPYRILSIIGIITSKNMLTYEKLIGMGNLFFKVLREIIFIPNGEIAFLIFAASIGFLIIHRRKKKSINFLLGILGISFAGIFLHHQPAEHYFSFLMPLMILAISYFLSFHKIGIIISVLLSTFSSYFIFLTIFR